MNKLRYRLVFNQARGMLMAVGETARSHVKGPGESAAPAGFGTRRGSPGLRQLAVLVAGAFGGILVSGAALAQVVADPNAPGTERPTVLNAANGVIQVNIQTPSASGVSRNKYTQFDVPNSGAILNNARTDVQTRLGGWVQANPWLKTGAARVILNEVNSSNPSRLQGFIEVAGQRAETVIANPAGIVVDGGGFINVSRATLTTGNPLLTDGRLTGFDVTRGQIAIEGAGLNGSETDYTALIARSVQVNAGLWASQLDVVTGVNRILLGETANARPGVTPAEGAGAPEFAIDVAQLGGMYANHIWLVGTEAGVGVRNAGEIGAAAGELVVTSSGRLENRGSIEADRIELTATSLVNRDGRIAQTGEMALDLTARDMSNNNGRLGQAAPAPAATPAPDGAAAPDAGTTVPALPVAATPAPAPAPVSAPTPAPAQPAGLIRATVLDNDGGLIIASGGLHATSASFANRGGEAHLEQLSVAGPVFDNAGGELQVRRALSATLDHFGNVGGKVLAGTTAQIVAGTLDNSGGLLQAANLTLQTGALDNSGGALRHTGAAPATFTVDGVLHQEKGSIDSASSLALRAGQISGANGVLNVTGDLDVRSGATSAAQASWRVGGDARIDTGDLDASGGAISVGGALALSAFNFDNTGGKLVAGAAASIRTGGVLDNTRGLIQAQGGFDVGVDGQLRNSAGTLEALGGRATFALRAAQIDNAAGRIVNAGAGATSIDAGSISSSGLIGGNGGLGITAGQLANASGGHIVSAADMRLSVSGLLANQGTIATASGDKGALAVDAGRLDNDAGTLQGDAGARIVVAQAVRNAGGTIAAGTDLLLRAAGDIGNARGAILGERIVVEGANIGNDGGRIVSAGDAIVQAAGTIANGGAIGAGGALVLAARVLDNGVQGDIAAQGPLRLDVDTRVVNTGRISSTGALTHDARGAVLDNSGVIIAGAALDLHLDRINNAGGAMLTTDGGAMALSANTLDNRAGRIMAGSAAGLDISANIDNAQGLIQAGGALAVAAGAHLDNAAGVIEALGADASLRLQSGSVDNTAGRIVNVGNGATLIGAGGHIASTGLIAGNGDVTLAVRTMQTGGELRAGGALALQVSQRLDNSGAISAATGLRMEQAGAALRNSGTVVAGHDIVLAVGEIDNSNGHIANARGANADLVLRAARIVNDGGAIMAERNAMLAATDGIHNAGGLVQAREDLQLEAGGVLDNSGGAIETLAAAGTLQVDAAALQNDRGRIVNTGGGATTLHVDGTLDNGSGLIAGNGALAVTAHTVHSSAGGSIASGAALTITAKDGIDNTGAISSRATLALESAALTNRGTLVAGADATIRTGVLDNDGGKIASAAGSGARLDVTAASLSNRDGSLHADAALALKVTGAIDNTKGALQGVTAVGIDAGAVLENDAGLIEATGAQAQLALQAGALANGSGRIVNVGSGATAINAGTIASNGLIAGNGGLDITTATLRNDAKGTLASGAAMTLAIGATFGNAGSVNSGGALAIGAHDASVRNSGVVTANGALTLDSGAFDNDGGQLATAKGSGAALRIDAVDISNRKGIILSDAAAAIASAGGIDNDGGTLQAAGSLDLDAGAGIRNDAGLIETLDPAATLALRAQALDNGSGRLVNVGTGDTTIAVGTLTNRGQLAGNGQVTIAAGRIDNGAGGTIAAGRGLGIDAGSAMDNAGALSSHDALVLRAAAASVRNSGQIVGGTDVTLDAGSFDNSGGQVVTTAAGGGDLVLRSGDIVNAGGALVAAGGARIDGNGKLDNTKGAIRAGDALAIAVAASLTNNEGGIEAGGAAATLDITAQAIDNGSGRLVNAGNGATRIVAATHLSNQGMVAGNGALLVQADSIVNGAAGKLSAGAAMDLQASRLLDNAGGISSAGALTVDQKQAAIANRGTVAAGGKVTLRAASIVNDSGQIATANGADIALDSTHVLSNRSGAIAAAGNATLSAGGAIDNSGGRVQTPGRLQVSAGGALENTAGALEATGAGSTLALDAAAIANSGRIVNSGAGSTTITSGAGIVNTGTIGGNGALDLAAATLYNGAAGVIVAGSALELAIRQSLENAGGSISSGGALRFDQAGATFANSGRIGAGGALDIRAAGIDNGGGQLYTAAGSGAAITLATGALRNISGKVAADGRLDIGASGAVYNDAGTLHGGRGLALGAGQALVNGSGVVEAASGALEVRAASIDSSGRIVNGGSGDTAIASQSGIVNSGAIAGNGSLRIAAESLHNGTGGQIGAGGALQLDVRRELANAGAISSAGSMTFDQAAASLANSGTIDAGGRASFVAASFNNDGGRISTVKGSGADISITAPWLSNRNGAILADGRASLGINGALDNRGGTLQAGSGLVLNAAGALSNDGGVIEAIGAGATLGIDAGAIDNGNGRIANLGRGETRLASQGDIANNGTIAAMGNLLLAGQTLQNGAAGHIAAGGNITLAINRQWTNRGNVNSSGALTFDQAGAVFVNSGQVMAGGDVLIRAAQVDNSGGRLGTGDGSGASLTLITGQLSNGGARIATDRDLHVSTRALSGLGQLFAGRDLALSMDGDYVHGQDGQIGSNRDLSLAVTGTITNNAAFQAAGKLTLAGRQISNGAGAVIEAQALSLRATDDVTNAGEIQGAGTLEIAAASVRNSGVVAGGAVTLSTGNLDNTGSAALIGATESLHLGVDGTLNNTDGATLYSAGNMAIGGVGGGSTGLVNNHSSTIEAAGDLALDAGTLTNVRDNVRIEQVTTVDETVNMRVPSWRENGRNHDYYDPKSSNYNPHELYFVNPNDILEETAFVTPDGHMITRAVIRTHANDSAFFVAGSGEYGAYGTQQRIRNTDGTKVIYYFGRSVMANPDQGGPQGNILDGREGMKKWAEQVTFSGAYGTCSTDCIRLVTQPGYDDPRNTIIRQTLRQLAPQHEKEELKRDAHHVAVEHRVAAGAGAQSQILSGGNMTLAVRDVIDNQYGDIKARGQLWMTGTAAIVNTGATLYRTHTFDGYWYTYDNTKTYYKQDSISEVIGSARGVIEGAQGVFINGRSFTNVDVTAGTVGNIRDSVQVIGSGQSGAGSAGANAASGNGGGAVLGHVTGSGGGTGAVLAGAQSASAGSSLATAGRSSASGVQNQLAGGSATGASGVTNGAGASGNASGSGAGNGLSVQGAAGASGVRNDGQTTVIAHAGAGQIGAGDVRSLGGAAGQGATSVQGSAIGETRKVAPGGLFLQNQNPSSDYLFETRPQFAKQDQWTSSDFLLDQLARDPALTQKRLGDGFYEQRLVREQLAELTGSAPNKGLSDDTIYKNLLTSGLSAAHEFGLRPGVALSAEQVAHLTSDIVWLVSETVQLPDGRIETVLVPKVYVAHAGKTALTPGGALVTGDGVTINVTDSIANIGGIIDGGNGRTVLVAGQDIVNRGGSIAGASVALRAGRDIRNESLVVKDSWATQQNSGSTTALSNTASIVTTGALNIDAGRDLTDLAGKLSAGSAVITAGNDIRFDTVKTGSTYDSLISGYTESNSSVTHQLSQVSTGGDLAMKAGGNLNLTGTQVAVGTGGKGSGIIAAGGAINIAAVKNEANSSVMNDASSKAYDKQVHRNETIVGAGVAAAGDLTVRAGVGGSADLNVTGSTLAGGGNVALSSTNNVNIASTTESHLSDVATHRESSSTFKKSSATKADYSATTQAIGSSISGNNVSIAAKNDITVGASELTAIDGLALGAGRDLIVTTAATTNTERNTLEEKKSGFSVSAGGIGYSKGQEQQTSGSESVTQVGSVLTGANVTTASGRDTVIQGSTVVADDDIAISAGRNLAIVSAQNSVSEDSASSSKQSGMIGSFFQPSIGTVKNKQDGTREAVTQSGSQLASLDGNVTLTAGNTYTQTASDVLTQTGDIVIGANNVLIIAAQDTTTGSDHSSYSKTAIGGTVSAPLLEAVRTVASMAEAAKDTGNARLTALAAINAASAISEMPTSVEAVQKAGIRVSIGLSNTKSESTTNSASSTAVGSTIKAGGNVTIVATGAGQDSNLTAIGSQISGGDSVTLAADNKVNLIAAESTASQHSTNKSSGSSIGVGFGIGGTSNGFTIDLAVSKARGNADGEDVTYTNTHVNGGQNVTVISGGDTTLKGGVITGKNVIADIGGDLNIESLQDRSTFESKQKSAGLNASLCLPPFCYGASTAGGNFAKSNVNGDFLSVQEQSGIKAGDGGFQVSVGGNTDLKGGVLGSSQAAIDEGKNLLLTGSLSASDLINKDEHSASGFSLSGSVSGMLGDQSGRPGNLTEAQKDAAQQAGKPTASGGIGSVSGSQSSVTQSGISGGVVVIADQDKQLATGKSAQAVLAGLDREVTSASSQSVGALAKDWDAQQLQKDVDAQVAITEKFSKIAPKEIADFSNKKAAELEAQGASPDEIAKWKEGGIYRTALHGVSGGLTGGLGGALGAGVVAGSAEALETLQKNVEMALLDQGVGLEAARAMAQSLAQATAIGVGAAVGGEAGAATGLATDTNNRQLDRKEITLLERLQKGKSPAGQQRLADAACALTRCSAGLMDGPVKDALQAQEKRGQQYTAEQSLLLKTGEFAYSPVHKAIDAFDRATRTATNGGSEAVFNIIGWAADGLADQLKSAGRGAVNLGYQVATHGPFGNAQTPPDLFDDSNGPRPGGATVSVIPVPMCVPPVCALVSVPVATPGTPGYVPSNALLSDSGGEGAGNSDTAPRADGANSSVDSYVSGLYKLETPTGKASGRFEVEQTGPYNYRVPAGNTTIDIDGYKGTTMLDAKFVEKPANSPYIENSNVPSFLRDKIRNEQQWEFERYKAAINDPTVPFNRLEVLTNEPRAVPYFQSLMDQFNTPGTVKVVPTQIPKKVPGSR